MTQPDERDLALEAALNLVQRKDDEIGSLKRSVTIRERQIQSLQAELDEYETPPTPELIADNRDLHKRNNTMIRLLDDIEQKITSSRIDWLD